MKRKNNNSYDAYAHARLAHVFLNCSKRLDLKAMWRRILISLRRSRKLSKSRMITYAFCKKRDTWRQSNKTCKNFSVI